jgi:LDH2 family malate/lactate/ureidoglycolate dehydrogenase
MFVINAICGIADSNSCSDQATENGELILALDPERFFGDNSAFVHRVEELLRIVAGRLPGERRLARRAATASSGSVEVDVALWSAVSGLVN